MDRDSTGGMDDLAEWMERLAGQTEGIHALVKRAVDWRGRLVREFVSGIARGIGFSVGFSLLSASILYLLRNAAMANLPVIGQFLAELVRIVERNL